MDSVVFEHFESNFNGEFGLTSGQNMPNFGAKWAQLQKPVFFPINLTGIAKQGGK